MKESILYQEKGREKRERAVEAKECRRRGGSRRRRKSSGRKRMPLNREAEAERK